MAFIENTVAAKRRNTYINVTATEEKILILHSLEAGKSCKLFDIASISNRLLSICDSEQKRHRSENQTINRKTGSVLSLNLPAVSFIFYNQSFRILFPCRIVEPQRNKYVKDIKKVLHQFKSYDAAHVNLYCKS